MKSTIPLEPSFRLLLIGLVALLGVAACAPPSKGPPREPSALAQAEALEAQGRYFAAATEYIRLTATVSPPQRQRYQLRAIAAFLQGHHLQEAQEILDSMAPAALDPPLQLRYRLLAARLSLAKRDAKQALAQLADIKPLKPNLEQQVVIHRLRAKAYRLASQPFAEIRERVQLEPLLSDAQALQENQRAIWQALMGLSPDTLETLRHESLPKVLSGWLELAQLFQRYQLDPLSLQQKINRWRERYPGHPASLPLIRAEMPELPPPPYQPTTIALLLPTEERFAPAAAAVRDGFFAAYYNDDSDWAPTIRFYAVKTNLETGESNVQQVYQQAQEEGAKFVVGPLTKQALASLTEMGDLPLPTLALNHLEQPHQALAGLYQLALSPEDEARDVAERAWHDGHSRALVLTPNNEWGQRVRQAFIAYWEELGGQLLESQAYNPQEEDFSLQIQRLLNLDKSESRYQALQEWLGRKLRFEPRRRHDADFIFLAAFPRQGRLLIPQLRFYRAGDLPVYSSSHVYTGHPDPQRDQDLNGLIFGDIPWVLNKKAQTDPCYQNLAAAYPENFERLKRLYALGTDAYRIIPHLNALQQVPGMSFEGATGQLRMDPERRLRRELGWARFKKGIPQPTAAQPPS